MSQIQDGDVMNDPGNERPHKVYPQMRPLLVGSAPTCSTAGFPAILAYYRCRVGSKASRMPSPMM